MLLHELLEQVGENSSQPRFVQTHRLLHQDTVDQLEQPLLAIRTEQHIGLRGGAGRRLAANALERHASEPQVQVGQRLRNSRLWRGLGRGWGG